jgi:hypothetical protein
VLRESEQHVLYGLSNAFGEVERAFALVSAQYNRLHAAKAQLRSSKQAYGEKEKVTIDIVLEAQRREAEADVRYHQARIEYALALKSVHFEKGTLLEYNNVFLTESGSPRAARYAALARREQLRPTISYVCRDIIVSQGKAGDVDLSTVPCYSESDDLISEPIPTPIPSESDAPPAANGGLESPSAPTPADSRPSSCLKSQGLEREVPAAIASGSSHLRIERGVQKASLEQLSNQKDRQSTSISANHADYTPWPQPIGEKGRVSPATAEIPSQADVSVIRLLPRTNEMPLDGR